MEVFIIVYLVLFSLVAGYFFWRFSCNQDYIIGNLSDVRLAQHSRIISYLRKIILTVKESGGDISNSINNYDKSLKNHITSENKTIKQMVMAQFSSQTVKLVEDVEINRQSLSNLASMVESLQSQASIGFKENSTKIGELSNSISHTISETASRTRDDILHLSSDEKLHSKDILTSIDMLFNNVSDFNKAIERQLILLEEADCKNAKSLDSSIISLSSSLKHHKENVASFCTQVLNTEKELHQKTKSSFDAMNVQFSKYLAQLKQIDLLYDDLQKLYIKLLEEEEKFSNQESSLAAMVSRHSQIFEITSEMNNTSKEIFEFMKLYLIQSTLDNFKK